MLEVKGLKPPNISPLKSSGMFLYSCPIGIARKPHRLFTSRSLPIELIMLYNMSGKQNALNRRHLCVGLMVF